MGKEGQQRPKANVSSYIHFMQHFRKKFKKQHPRTYLGFEELSRMCSEKWRSISKREKAKYEALAKLDKDRYKKEMKNFPGKIKKRRTRDPKAPRKPPTAFLLFSQDHYAQLKQENPDWTVVQVARAAGRMWSLAEEADKMPYKEKAALMRAKYFQEMENYRNRR